MRAEIYRLHPELEHAPDTDMDIDALILAAHEPCYICLLGKAAASTRPNIVSWTWYPEGGTGFKTCC